MRRFLSPGFLGVMIVAVLAGLLGVYVFRAVGSKPEAEPPRPRPTNVPLASADLPAERVITEGDVSLMPMSVEAMKEKGPLDVLMLSSDQIIGRRLKRPLSTGQAFLTTDLYLEGSGPQMDELLKPGFRAISIEVPAVRGGSVSPGQTVDVLFRSESRKGDDRQASIPEKAIVLFEGVEVLSVFRPEGNPLQPAAGNASKAPMVTLAVTPDQATRLQAVEGRGEISLAVRPPREFVALAGGSAGITLEEILGVPAPAPPAPAEASASQRQVSEIYRRNARQVNTFLWQGGGWQQQATRYRSGARPVADDALPPASAGTSSGASPGASSNANSPRPQGGNTGRSGS